MFRFTIRELLILIALVALALGWLAERWPRMAELRNLRAQNEERKKLVAQQRQEIADYKELAKGYDWHHRFANRQVEININDPYLP